MSHDASLKTLKPLCPTTWLCKVSSVSSVVEQYEAVLKSLEETASVLSDMGTKCQGLLDMFQNGHRRRLP
jgi:hypothetical protein